MRPQLNGSATQRERSLSLSFGQGALLEGRDWWKTNITKALEGEAAVQGRAKVSSASATERLEWLVSLRLPSCYFWWFFFLESLMFDICAISVSVLLTADARIRRFGKRSLTLEGQTQRLFFLPFPHLVDIPQTQHIIKDEKFLDGVPTACLCLYPLLHFTRFLSDQLSLWMKMW